MRFSYTSIIYSFSSLLQRSTFHVDTVEEPVGSVYLTIDTILARKIWSNKMRQNGVPALGDITYTSTWKTDKVPVGHTND